MQLSIQCSVISFNNDLAISSTHSTDRHSQYTGTSSFLNIADWRIFIGIVFQRNGELIKKEY